jgi:hypothetical protein
VDDEKIYPMNTIAKHTSRSTADSPLRKGLRHAGYCGLFICASLGSLAAAAAGVNPGAPVTVGNVEVSYSNPDKFTEIDFDSTKRTDWLAQLSAYVANRAQRSLPPGEKLSVTITDVQLAGGFEPWHRGDLARTRIVRDTRPPRIDLRFKVEAASGGVIKEGERKLRDIAFLDHSVYHRSEPLAHEKNLIDTWLTKEFGPSQQ